MRHTKVFIIIFALFVLQFSAAHADVFTVKHEVATIPLYFSGNVAPFSVSNVTTPAEGVVVEKSFKYGERVSKGQNLVKISSSKLETDFHSALRDFLTAKDAFNTAKRKYQQDKFLYGEGIIPKNTLDESQSNMNNANVTYLEALYSLEEAVRTGQGLTEDVKKLDISDIASVDKTLKLKYNFVSIPATADGIALAPQKAGSGEDTQDKVVVGTQLKYGQVITSIADLSGLSITIQVNEVDVNHVKVGQKAKVTGDAFPGVNLEGVVNYVASEAGGAAGGESGVPTFTVHIEVKNLPKEAQKVIRMGMSCNVELDTTRSKSIMIPIKAVYQKDDKSYVNVLVDGRAVPTEVKTGQTTPDNVEILSGIKDGDQIQLPDDDAKKK